MGSRIPEFVTRKLASSVTGTVGLDSSRSALFGKISAGASQVFDTIQRKTAENQVVTQGIEADKIIRQYEAKAEQGIGVIQQAMAKNPGRSVEAADKEGDKLLQETLSGISSPRLKAMVSSRVTAMNRGLRKGMKKWTNDQIVRNAMVDFSEIDNTDSGGLEQNPSMDALYESIARNGERLPTANLLFSPSGAVAAIRNGNESRAKATLFGFMRTDPEEGMRALREGEFNSLLPQKDLRKFKSDMQDAIEGGNVLTNLEAAFGGNGVLDEFQGQVESGNYKPLELEAKRDELEEAGTITPQQSRFFKHALGLVRTRRYLNSKDNVESLSNLLTNYKILKEDLREGGDAQASLDNMLDFKADVVEMLDKQLITADKAAMMMSLVKIPVDAQAQILGEVEGEESRLQKAFKFAAPGFSGASSLFFQGTGGDSDIKGFIKIEQYIENKGLFGREKELLDSKLKVELLFEMRKFENLSPDGTVSDDQVSKILGRILAHEGQAAGIAKVADTSEVLRYDTKTGQVQKQKPDGSWEVVK